MLHTWGEKWIQGLGGKARRKETTSKTYTWMKDNIKMGLRETDWGGMDWIDLVQDWE
jgi:hypothetical protein